MSLLALSLHLLATEESTSVINSAWSHHEAKETARPKAER